MFQVTIILAILGWGACAKLDNKYLPAKPDPFIHGGVPESDLRAATPIAQQSVISGQYTAPGASPGGSPTQVAGNFGSSKYLPPQQNQFSSGSAGLQPSSTGFGVSSPGRFGSGSAGAQPSSTGFGVSSPGKFGSGSGNVQPSSTSFGVSSPGPFGYGSQVSGASPSPSSFVDRTVGVSSPSSFGIGASTKPGYDNQIASGRPSSGSFAVGGLPKSNDNSFQGPVSSASTPAQYSSIPNQGPTNGPYYESQTAGTGVPQFGSFGSIKNNFGTQPGGFSGYGTQSDKTVNSGSAQPNTGFGGVAAKYTGPSANFVDANKIGTVPFAGPKPEGSLEGQQSAPAGQYYGGSTQYSGPTSQYSGPSGQYSNEYSGQYSGQNEIKILRYDNNPNYGDGSYSYNYETENGIAAQEEGATNGDKTEAHGGYSYISPEGEQIKIEYVADENGYQPKGSHVPEIPEAIKKSIELNKASEARGEFEDGQYREDSEGNYQGDGDDGSYKAEYGSSIPTNQLGGYKSSGAPKTSYAPGGSIRGNSLQGSYESASSPTPYAVETPSIGTPFGASKSQYSTSRSGSTAPVSSSNPQYNPAAPITGSSFQAGSPFGAPKSQFSASASGPAISHYGAAPTSDNTGSQFSASSPSPSLSFGVTKSYGVPSTDNSGSFQSGSQFGAPKSHFSAAASEPMASSYDVAPSSDNKGAQFSASSTLPISPFGATKSQYAPSASTQSGSQFGTPKTQFSASPLLPTASLIDSAAPNSFNAGTQFRAAKTSFGAASQPQGSVETGYQYEAPSVKTGGSFQEGGSSTGPSPSSFRGSINVGPTQGAAGFNGQTSQFGIPAPTSGVGFQGSVGSNSPTTQYGASSGNIQSLAPSGSSFQRPVATGSFNAPAADSSPTSEIASPSSVSSQFASQKTEPATARLTTFGKRPAYPTLGNGDSAFSATGSGKPEGSGQIYASNGGYQY